MASFSSEWLVILTLTAVFTVMLTALMFMYRTTREGRYDVERHRVELELFRRTLEREIGTLTDRLVATEDRFRDVNHLLLSSQARQLERLPESQELRLTPFLRSAGIEAADLSVKRDLVFVLTPFNPDYEKDFETISLACRELGLRGLRGDEEAVSGELFPHILKLIIRARLIVANVTGRNPNVFYELGLAHALGKMTIIVSRAPLDVPFDVVGKKLVIYRSGLDLRRRLRAELARALALDLPASEADT